MSSDIKVEGFPYFPGVASGRLRKTMVTDNTPCILLLSQADLATVAVLPAGLIVVDAAPFSHQMIAILGLGIPTVLINSEQAMLLGEDTELMIDGGSGIISGGDQSAQLNKFTQVRCSGKPVLMADGELVNLSASVRDSLAAREAIENGAAGIGLVRSEFLVPDNDAIPDTDFYISAFSELCEAASSLKLTFRLLDIADDKMPGWLKKLNRVTAASGKQGVRLYNQEPVDRVIEAQLAALATVSAKYAIRVLLPFLVRLEEYEYWRGFVRQRLPDNIPVGAMVETPAMLLDINQLIKHADFVSIGCNDLIQFLNATDRDQSELHDYLDPYAPYLYRLFRQVAEQAGSKANQINLCGVWPQMQCVLPVLLGLGYRSFSVESAFIPHLANIVINTTKVESEKLAKRVCDAISTQQVLQLLQLSINRHPPFYL